MFKTKLSIYPTINFLIFKINFMCKIKSIQLIYKYDFDDCFPLLYIIVCIPIGLSFK